MYACSAVSGTPARASAAAGAARSASGMLPQRRAAASSPAGLPGTAHDAAPQLNTWTASPNEISTGSSSA